MTTGVARSIERALIDRGGAQLSDGSSGAGCLRTTNSTAVSGYTWRWLAPRFFAVLPFARTVFVEDAPASDAVTAAAAIAAFFVLRSLWFLSKAPR